MGDVVEHEPAGCPEQDRLDAFLARTLRPGELVELEAHFDTCDDCRRLVFALAPDESPGSEARRIGRYIVTRQLGEGAMGVVFAARDPALRRDIAIKLLRGAAAHLRPDAAVRLRREAQGLARLAHPNVVSIYDVGTHDDEVYLAMELIDGGSFASWLSERPRPWRAIVRVLLQAAEGLAVAHAAGLIHRDIKPHNVMVTTDGRAKVVDFGLAHSAGAVRSTSPDDIDDIAVRLTATGSIVGTPAYSAPEVLAGELGDPRSDVFSFCVMAFEAFYGRRPYEAQTLGELRELAVKPVEIPGAPRLPSVLRRMLRSGLQADRLARPAMIGELVPLLRAALVPRGKIVAGVVAGVALIAGVSAMAVQLADKPAADPCELDPAGVPAWTTAREQRITTAFAAAKRPYASAAADHVVTQLRAFPAQWSAARRSACVATRVHGQQSDELFDLRVACLDQRARGVDTLGGLLEVADAALVERSADAVASATSLVACQGGRELLSPMRPPQDPGRAARFTTARIALERADSLRLVGKTDEAGVIAKGVRDEADAIAHPALGARAAWIFATVSSTRDDAQALFEDAARRAEAAGDDRTRVEVGVQLVQVWSATGKTADVEKLLRDLDAIMTRIGAPPDLVASLAYQRGRTKVEQAAYAEAEAWMKIARMLQVATQPVNPDTLWIDSELALVVAELDRLDEGDRILVGALADAERKVGAGHPVVNALHSSRGRIASAAKKYELARDELTVAAAGFDTGEGTDKIQGAHARADLATVLLELGDPKKAAEVIERAVVDLEQLMGAEAADVGIARSFRAKVLAAGGEAERAITEYDRAIVIIEKVVGPDHPRVAGVIAERGGVQLTRGRVDAAISDLARAHAIFAKTFDKKHPIVVEAAASLAKARAQATSR